MNSQTPTPATPKSNPEYIFTLTRQRLLALAGCAVAAAILLFLAGSISGLLISSRSLDTPSAGMAKARQVEAATPLLDKPAQGNAPATPAPNAGTPGTASESSVASSASAGNSPTAPSAETTMAPMLGAPAAGAPTQSTATPSKQAPPTIPASNATVKPDPAPASPDPVADLSYAFPLAVRVGSFTHRENAESLIASLTDHGYKPAMTTFTDARGRTWYGVRLGPYTRWSTASQVATRVSLAENLTPIIGPMQ